MGGLGFYLFLSRIPARVFSIKSPPLSLPSPPPRIHLRALSSALTGSLASGRNADTTAGGWSVQDGLGFLLSSSLRFQRGFSPLTLLLLLFLLTPGCQPLTLIQCLAFEHNFALVLVTEILWMEEPFGISIRCPSAAQKDTAGEVSRRGQSGSWDLQLTPAVLVPPGHAEAHLKCWRRSSHVE